MVIFVFEKMPLLLVTLHGWRLLQCHCHIPQSCNRFECRVYCSILFMLNLDPLSRISSSGPSPSRACPRLFIFYIMLLILWSYIQSSSSTNPLKYLPMVDLPITLHFLDILFASALGHLLLILHLIVLFVPQLLPPPLDLLPLCLPLNLH